MHMLGQQQPLGCIEQVDFFLSKYGCDDRFSGAMIERGVLLRPQIQHLGIRALVFKSTLKSCTHAIEEKPTIEVD